MATKKGVLIAFSVQSEKFVSNYERNKFFHTLYGWTQTISGGKKEYVYRREGILDEMPHVKVDQSSFIVEEDDFDKLFRFFHEWSNKVIWKTFKVLLDEETINKLEESEEEIEEEEEL